MAWNGETPPSNRNAWQVPKKEVVLHENSAAVEDLNIYPENISLPPHLVQNDQILWDFDIKVAPGGWGVVEDFYSIFSFWKENFYAVAGGWVENFYAAIGGWLAGEGFYGLSGKEWKFSFYPSFYGWLQVPELFYTDFAVWTEFYPAVGPWNELFYTAGGIWTILEE